MPWTSENNEQLAQTLQSFASDLAVRRERAGRILAKFHGNDVANAETFVDTAALSREEMLEGINLCTQIVALVDGGDVLKGDWKTIISHLTRNVGV